MLIKELPEVAERQTKGLIYSAINKLIEDSKVDPIKSLNIRWEEFNAFTPMQIIGVMMLKKEKANAILVELFPPIFK